MANAPHAMGYVPTVRPASAPTPQTWLPVPASYETINVQRELADPAIIIELVSKAHPAAAFGSRAPRADARSCWHGQNASVLSYVRVDTDNRAVLVSLNMSSTAQTISLDLVHAGVDGSSSRH